MASTSAMQTPVLIRKIIAFACPRASTSPRSRPLLAFYSAVQFATVASDWMDVVQDMMLETLWKRIVLAYQSSTLGTSSSPPPSSRHRQNQQNEEEEEEEVNHDVLFRLLMTVCDLNVTTLIRPLCQLSDALFRKEHHHHHHHHQPQQQRRGNVLDRPPAPDHFDVVNQQTLFGTRPLNIAAKRGSVALVRELLSVGAIAHVRSESDFFLGDPPILDGARASKHTAALEICRLLISEGVPVDACCAHGVTPLFVAVSVSNVALAEFLLEQGAVANTAKVLQLAGKQEHQHHQHASRVLNSNALVNSCLHAAVKGRASPEMFQLLFTKAGYSKEFVDVKAGSTGESALAVAVRLGSIELVDLLMQHGAEFTEKIWELASDDIKQKFGNR